MHEDFVLGIAGRAVGEYIINRFAGPNVINPTNHLCGFEVSVGKNRSRPRARGAEVPRGYIKATDITVGAFHGGHYHVTSAWPNVICLTPPR